MTAPTPRLTQAESARVDDFCRAAFRPATSNEIWLESRILDLLDERADLIARAEQAERDRDTLAKEVRAWRAFDEACKQRNNILHCDHPIDHTRLTDASDALTRSKEQQ